MHIVYMCRGEPRCYEAFGGIMTQWAVEGESVFDGKDLRI